VSTQAPDVSRLVSTVDGRGDIVHRSLSTDMLSAVDADYLEKSDIASQSPSPGGGGYFSFGKGALAELAESTLQSACDEGILRPLRCSDSMLSTAFQVEALLWAALSKLGTAKQGFLTEMGPQVSVFNAVQSALAPGMPKPALGGSSERLLWHGTSWQSVSNILRNGFNRAYSGRHGTKFGVGTYFAVDIDYALNFCDKASPRVLILARVFVGRFAKGSRDMLEAPLIEEPKHSIAGVSSITKGHRYDSTVDNVVHPRVFCVFRDFQALPVGVVAWG